MESPWRSLEMGIRIPEWANAFFWLQQAPEFSVDARVLMLLGVAEHVEVCTVGGWVWYNSFLGLSEWVDREESALILDPWNIGRQPLDLVALAPPWCGTACLPACLPATV